MATLVEIADLAQHPQFVRRVTAATVKSAVAVGAEEYDGSQYRIIRRALSMSVLKQAEAWGEVFAWAVAANSAIDIDSADSDIEWTIGSVWDAVAGAYSESTPEAPVEPA